MIQKVSGIYSIGFSSGSYIGPSGGLATTIGSGKPMFVTGVTTVHGMSQTDLSKKLSPLEKPKEPYITSELANWAAIVVWAIIGFYVLIKLDIVFGVLTLIGGLIVAYRFVKTKDDRQKKKENYYHSVEQWKKAMARWERLYYCVRDDCVFDPMNGEYTTSDKMRRLLYS
jgi:hypothetical protein